MNFYTYLLAGAIITLIAMRCFRERIKDIAYNEYLYGMLFFIGAFGWPFFVFLGIIFIISKVLKIFIIGEND